MHQERGIGFAVPNEYAAWHADMSHEFQEKGDLPQGVLEALSGLEPPCFVYDARQVTKRIRRAASLLDRYFFPVKACPETGVIRAAIAAGAGLDLCSEGDLELARASGCPGSSWKFTGANATDRLLCGLAETGAALDADSLEQALRWRAWGRNACGLRVMGRSPKGLYGWKFGIPAPQAGDAAQRLAATGMRVEGIHMHDQQANLTANEFATHLIDTIADIERGILGDCRYINIGGSWPMRHGNPASLEELGEALGRLRERLGKMGFKGALYGEPGRWVVGPCGYWAARVAAVKAHPLGDEHRIVVLDTNTPVPCRPSLLPFLVLRDGAVLKGPARLSCDLFGSANTALDCIGQQVRLPYLAVGDVIVSLGQGAYTRSLIPPFNERERPAATVLG